jgi:hypothetical protein
MANAAMARVPREPHGVALAELDATGRAALIDGVGATVSDRRALAAELAALADTLDAVGDLRGHGIDTRVLFLTARDS